MYRSIPWCNIKYIPCQAFDKMEVTGIVCPRQRIITGGWNQRLTVYMDCREEDDDSIYHWAVRHKEDILSVAFYPPSTIASASFDGDILIWSLETGYVTTQFNVDKGTEPFAGMKYAARKDARSGTESGLSEFTAGLSLDSELDSPSACRPFQLRTGENPSVPSEQCLQLPPLQSLHPELVYRSLPDERPSRRILAEGPQDRRQSLLPTPAPLLFTPSVDLPVRTRFTEAGSAVDKLLFLESRRNTKRTATLMASSAAGWLRAWSIHHEGGLLGQWNAAHKKDESVLALATDSANEYLITGDSLGYIKVDNISFTL